MKRQPRTYPCAIEKLVDTLSLEAKEAWLEFASVGKTLLDLQAWWSERGHHVSLDALVTWRKKHLKAGQRAKEIVKFLEECRGINPISCLEYAAVTSVWIAEELKQRLEQEFNKSETALLLNALKEARATASVLHEAQVRSDRLESVLAGCYELSFRCLRESEGDCRSEWLEAILRASLVAIEDELKSGQKLSDCN